MDAIDTRSDEIPVGSHKQQERYERQRLADKHYRTVNVLVRQQRRELDSAEPQHLAAMVTQFANDAETAFIAADAEVAAGNPAYLAHLRKTIADYRSLLASRRLLLPLVEGELLAPSLFQPAAPMKTTDTAPTGADGPFGFDGFRWRGKEHRGLQLKVWLLIDWLWRQPDRSGSTDDANIAVYGDDESDYGLVSCRTHANKYFLRNRIPLRVRIRDKRIVLREEK